jgi:hypothetical protein
MTADPWALLRQARNELDVLASYAGHPDTKWPTVGLMMTAVAQKKLRDRIDAALAAHRDEVPAQDSAKDVVESDAVEWRDCLSVDESMFLAADLSDKLKVSVYPEEATPGAYPWRAVRIEAQEGTAPTEAEAKAAAIAAARGMR